MKTWRTRFLLSFCSAIMSTSFCSLPFCPRGLLGLQLSWRKFQIAGRQKGASTKECMVQLSRQLLRNFLVLLHNFPSYNSAQNIVKWLLLESYKGVWEVQFSFQAAMCVQLTKQLRKKRRIDSGVCTSQSAVDNQTHLGWLVSACWELKLFISSPVTSFYWQVNWPSGRLSSYTSHNE